MKKSLLTKWFILNEYYFKNIMSNNWRASLVPAAAVIPAPIVSIKFVAVKKLVVELLNNLFTLNKLE